MSRDVRNFISLGELLELMHEADPENTYTPLCSDPETGFPVFYTADKMVDGKLVEDTRIKVKNASSGRGATFSITQRKFISHWNGKTITGKMGGF